MPFITRRTFLSLIAAGIAVPALGAQAQTPGRIRTISYNVLAFRGYPHTSKTSDALDATAAEHPEMTARALKAFDPDIISLQEGPPEELVARFAKELGMNHVWFKGGWEGNDDYPGGFPGAIITKYPIIASENRPDLDGPHPETLFTRHLGRAVLDTPIGRLHVISTHFHASDHEVRMQEAAAIVRLVKYFHSSGPVLLQGDLNHKPDDPEYAIWKDAGLVDIGAQHGIGEAPTFSSVRPNTRIDYVWGTAELGRASRHAQVLNETPFVPAPGDEASYALSDHLPVLADFDPDGLA